MTRSPARSPSAAATAWLGASIVWWINMLLRSRVWSASPVEKRVLAAIG